MNQKTKQIIAAVVIIVVAFIGFKFFSSGVDSGDPLTVDGGSAPVFVDGQAVLILLNKLNAVRLDESIFSNKVFNGLVSFEEPIPDQVPGRMNPFAPIGTDRVDIVSVSTSTNNPATTSRIR